MWWGCASVCTEHRREECGGEVLVLYFSLRFSQEDTHSKVESNARNPQSFPQAWLADCNENREGLIVLASQWPSKQLLRAAFKSGVWGGAWLPQSTERATLSKRASGVSNSWSQDREFSPTLAVEPTSNLKNKIQRNWAILTNKWNGGVWAKIFVRGRVGLFVFSVISK